MTFTKMAAESIRKKLGNEGRDVTACTIHSLCLGLAKTILPGKLDKYGGMEGRAVEEVLRELSREDEEFKKLGVDTFLYFIAKCKGTGPVPIFGNPFGMNHLGGEHVRAVAVRSQGIASIGPVGAMRAYNAYEARRTRMGFYSFDDQISFAWMRLVSDENFLTWVRSMWAAIIMDEAQDSSLLQWDIARLLYGLPSQVELPEGMAGTTKMDTSGRSLVVAGDSSQSVYSWRSAEPELFIKFATDAGTKQIVLHKSYRFMSEVAEVATKFLEKEPWHLGGKIVAVRGDAKEPRIWITSYPDIAVEARGVIARCKSYVEGGGKYSDCAVLSRLSGFLHLAEIHCLEYDIPYEKRASGTFMTSKPVMDMLCYMKLILGTASFEEQKKVVLAPFRFISKQAFIDAQRQMQMRANVNLIDALLLDKDLYKRQKTSILHIRWLIEQCGSMNREGIGPEGILEEILRKTKYREYLMGQQGARRPDASSVAIIHELQTLSAQHTTLQSFVEELGSYQTLTTNKVHSLRVKRHKPGEDFIVLSTIHQMKGLQAPHIFLADVSAGRMPWEGGHTVDEEKRLFYVAVTRAQESVNISYNAVQGPSPYIKRLREEILPKPQKGNDPSES